MLIDLHAHSHLSKDCELNPKAVVCFYGLYASLNSDYLLEHGGDYCIGGEVETPLVGLIEALDAQNGNGNGSTRKVARSGTMVRLGDPVISGSPMPPPRVKEAKRRAFAKSSVVVATLML